MRISDWSSDVCSSDLIGDARIERGLRACDPELLIEHERARTDLAHRGRYLGLPRPAERAFGAEFAQFEHDAPDLVARLGGGDEHRFGVAILPALRITIAGRKHPGPIRASHCGHLFPP